MHGSPASPGEDIERGFALSLSTWAGPSACTAFGRARAAWSIARARVNRQQDIDHSCCLESAVMGAWLPVNWDGSAARSRSLERVMRGPNADPFTSVALAVSGGFPWQEPGPQMLAIGKNRTLGRFGSPRSCKACSGSGRKHSQDRHPMNISAETSRFKQCPLVRAGDIGSSHDTLEPAADASAPTGPFMCPQGLAEHAGNPWCSGAATCRTSQCSWMEMVVSAS
jgi:hypothetical protein